MGLLTGLEKFGLKYLENAEVFEEEKKKEKEAEKPKVKVFTEVDYLFDKSHECPVCYNMFKERTIRSGRVRLLKTDIDLRPVYENIEPLKYEVVICPHCGYAALNRYFTDLRSSQIKAIKEVMAFYKHYFLKKDTYTYEEAVERYKLCLANAIVKKAKTSEKAFICLKGGWLFRSMGDYYKENYPEDEKKKEEVKGLKEQEKEFLKNALDGFVTAMRTETFPICGMDENTMDYLVGVLAMEDGQYDLALKLISHIITSRSANNRVKDKARDVKEKLAIKIKESNAGKA